MQERNMLTKFPLVFSIHLVLQTIFKAGFCNVQHGPRNGAELIINFAKADLSKGLENWNDPSPLFLEQKLIIKKHFCWPGISDISAPSY